MSDHPTPQTQVEALLARMRGGDRDAAAEFVTTYANRIRARLGPELGRSMRRLYDSQDIVSTVARRLDAFVRAGKVSASTPQELWALVFRIAGRSVIDRMRVMKKLQSAEGEDSPFAQAWARRLEEAEKADRAGVEIEIERALRALDDDTDRQILSMWLTDTALNEIAAVLEMSEGTVRWRWSKIRDKLRRLVTLGDAGP